MFDRIRQIHLFAAFILTAFILMYFVTGFVMIFEHSFQRKDNSVKKLVKEIPGIRVASNDQLLSALRENFDVRGQYDIRTDRSGVVVTFRHPGTEASARVAVRSDSVTLTVKEKNLIAVLHQFHRQHGYRGGWNYWLWAFFYDLTAISMIIFAITGIYLWYRIERNKWPGAAILLAMTCFVAFTFYYLNR